MARYEKGDTVGSCNNAFLFQKAMEIGRLRLQIKRMEEAKTHDDSEVGICVPPTKESCEDM